MVLGKLGPEKVDSWAPKSEVNFMCEFLCVCVCGGGHLSQVVRLGK